MTGKPAVQELNPQETGGGDLLRGHTHLCRPSYLAASPCVKAQTCFYE